MNKKLIRLTESDLHRIAHNANRLHNKLLGLNPDEEFGHINDENFGNGMRDAAIDHKFRKRG